MSYVVRILPFLNFFGADERTQFKAELVRPDFARHRLAALRQRPRRGQALGLREELAARDERRHAAWCASGGHRVKPDER
jgi:hypothetical protein